MVGGMVINKIVANLLWWGSDFRFCLFPSMENDYFWLIFSKIGKCFIIHVIQKLFINVGVYIIVISLMDQFSLKDETG